MPTGSDTATDSLAQNKLKAASMFAASSPPSVSLQRAQNGFIVTVNGFDPTAGYYNKTFIAVNELGMFDLIHEAFSSKA